MTREERAKQFMPFDAMKGLKEALAKQEELYYREQKREISDDEKEIIAREIIKLELGDRVKIKYYHNFREVVIEGIFESLNTSIKYILVSDKKIFIEDIYEIEKI